MPTDKTAAPVPPAPPPRPDEHLIGELEKPRRTPDSYAPVHDLALKCQRSRQTVYAWVRRYGLRTRRDPRGRLLVHIADAMQCENKTRPEHERRQSR